MLNNIPSRVNDASPQYQMQTNRIQQDSLLQVNPVMRQGEAEL